MTSQDNAFYVIGVAARTTNAAESDPATARLPALWGRAYRDPYLTAQREREAAELVAVLTDYESDHTGAYTQIVGVRAASANDLPERLVAVHVPAELRLEVPAQGAMPDALIAAWQHIWQETEAGEIARAYRTDYELHSPDGATIYLSTRGG